jgi:hypothetical protein
MIRAAANVAIFLAILTLGALGSFAAVGWYLGLFA